MILYPTETIYGIGVNPFDESAMAELFELKGRDERKVSAWLVRNLEDLSYFGAMYEPAKKIAERFLPGQMTLVLPAKDTVPSDLQSDEGTIGLRISSDPLAKELIACFFEKYNAPLTCTSANVSGMESESNPEKIISQFKANRPSFSGFSEVIDGGERSGTPSTVVKVIGEEVTVLRDGHIPEEQIRNCVE